VILSPIEQSIKRKIEAVGTPLKDWGVKINYGIKTGYNPAFIIDSAKRDEILANCQTEDERIRTAELIRPILRGRDIKRYGYEWAGLWLINSHNGIKGKLERIHIEDYPSIKAHLDQYWDKIATRADKGDTPYNLRNCAYMEDFSRPKIVWAELARTGNAFSLDFSGHIVGNTAYMLSIDGDNPEKLTYMLAFLNSRCMLYSLNQISTRLDDTGWRWLRQFVELLRIPPFHNYKEINNAVKSINKNNKKQTLEYINLLIYKMYDFTRDEIVHINKELSNF